MKGVFVTRPDLVLDRCRTCRGYGYLGRYFCPDCTGKQRVWYLRSASVSLMERAGAGLRGRWP
jgi:DnaJ-class molecular chaperone